MTVDLRRQRVYAVLLDIEGTTTPLAFVEETLYPFARRNLADYLEARRDSEALVRAIAELAAEHAAESDPAGPPPPWHSGTMAETLASVRAYVPWLMDRDRKSPGLKRLQGLIWEQGYQAGELRGEVFADVPGALLRFRRVGVDIAIYSSGSELAQRRLFESTPDGDLTPLIAAFFDTRVGPKTDADSYTRIAAALKRPPTEVLFLSDVTAELAAARSAGMQVVLVVRPGNRAQPDEGEYGMVPSLDELTG